MEITSAILDAATDALDLKLRIDKLTVDLNERKEQLRKFAADEKLEVIVEGKGKVSVSKPREGKEEFVLVVDAEKLKLVPDLKSKLMGKGVIKEELKKFPAAKASVTVEPNV